MGTYSADVIIPDEPGLLFSFFLYKQKNNKVYEIDFEFIPNDSALWIGTYDNWIEKEHGYQHNPPYREKPDKIDIDDNFWGKKQNLKFVRSSQWIGFYINNSLKWIAIEAIPEEDLHIMFNVWSPREDDFPSPGKVNKEIVNYYIQNISYTPESELINLEDWSEFEENQNISSGKISSGFFSTTGQAVIQIIDRIKGVFLGKVFSESKNIAQTLSINNASSISFTFDHLMTDILIHAADFGGGTEILCYNGKGRLLHRQLVTNQGVELIDLSHLQHVKSIVIQSSAGFVGPLSYSIDDQSALPGVLMLLLDDE